MPRHTTVLKDVLRLHSCIAEYILHLYSIKGTVPWAFGLAFDIASRL